ncbi:ChrR family anti-sigma-E factor [Teredinibacter turnerae]|uniref:ChrR family anti-sigma-E factor n=1 Tax=Teredinibacter turnerae TaxID=2426 RepID=UPI0030D16855
MIKHHPSAELLADYASGSLKPSHSLCIAAHLEQCESCRRQAMQLELLGAQLFDQLRAPAATNTDTLKAAVFANLDDDATPEVNTASKSAITSAIEKYRVPRALGQFLQGGYSELSWVKVSPSIKITTLLKDKDGSQIALSRVKPGGKMPHHRHTGDELTVVLEGAFSDETGLYRKGDFVSRDSRHKHKPMVTKDSECICLMVLDAPIEFTGMFSRFLNPLVKRNHSHG